MTTTGTDMTLRERNAVTNGAEFEARSLHLTSYPTILFLELTQNCNLACKMCRAPSGYDRGRDMPLEVFDRALTELGPYALLVDLNGWGESTIVAGFRDRLIRALDLGTRVRLVTNGHAMTQPLWEAMFNADNIIIVSFDSASPDLFQALGRGDFNRVVRNVRQGVDIRNRKGQGAIFFNVVVSRYTLSELPNIVRLAGNLGLDRVLVNPVKCPPDHPGYLGHCIDQIPVVLDRASTVARETGIKMQLGAALDNSLAVEYGLPVVCSNPWTNAVIDYRGHVGYCNHAIGQPEYMFGSLMESDFASIWNGPDFIELRRQLVEAATTRRVSSRFPKCEWCYYNRYGDAGLPDQDMEGRKVSTETGLPLYKPAELPSPKTSPFVILNNR